MAASNQIQGMYDVALKPQLLRSLLKEYVPDEKHPFRNPSDLSHVVSAVKTHRLLSECAPHSTNQKLIESWKSAVDAWVKRVSALASSNMPDKSWAGICLLGLTCQECSSERFLASYSEWFNKIFSHIQPPSDSHFVRVASCSSMSDLFTRLGGFPNAKKDGTSQASKLIQPLLKLLNEDGSEVAWEEAISLLCTLVQVFPSSVSRHYDNVEASIFSKFMSENCNVSIVKKLAHGFAILPKSRGDEDSWSLMMQKFLIFINNQLNITFQGLEEEARSIEIVRLLLPPGKDPPPPLGGATASGKNSDQAMKRPEQVLVSRVSTLMTCCCTMLTHSYPVQVAVPVRALVALVKRVLLVDGSLSQSYPFMTAMRQDFICLELPVLHACSMELLSAIVKGLRSQLLPHVADITRLLTEYFRTCALPELRIKVYSIMKALLMSMGIGIAIYLIQEVISNALIDLDPHGHESSSTCSAAYSKATEEAMQQPSQRKRKHPTSTGSLGDQSTKGSLEVEKNQYLTPISVRIAALEALEALLTVAGALRSDGWRSDIDNLLITVATTACKVGWSDDKSTVVYGEANPVWEDFQLAALRALLASLLSPGRVRPPHLAEGLELFRRGTRESGTKISEYCSHALLALEVLIHPRALPVIDFQSAVDHYDGASLKPSEINSRDQRKNTSFHFTQGKQPPQPESDDDDLYESWLANSDGRDETEVPLTKLGKYTSSDKEPSGTSTNPSFEKLPHGDFPSATNEHEEGEHEASLTVATDVVSVDRDEMIIELVTDESYKQPEDHDHLEARNLVAAAGDHTVIKSDALVSSSITSKYTDFVVESGKDVSSSETDRKTTVFQKSSAPTSATDEVTSQDDEYTRIMERISATISNSERGKGVVVEIKDDASMDSIPDIVDGDPDSD
ncbi:hypothetical protein ACH5RR_019031 [Cinchona calisaya]|uniref:Pre-rRNA-processing protein RIX1 N-terminal domain-containing protein n=1 Tax=Cinchona calisaya TaxID=153742 RepID=A0ABD2ZR00_9GENT